MTYYVYRFLDKQDRVIYVGKTNNVRIRILKHFNTSVNKDVERNLITEKIQFSIHENKAIGSIYEIFFINLWKPIFNSSLKYEGIVKEDFLEKVEWFDFDELILKDRKLKNKEYRIQRVQNKEVRVYYAKKVLNIENLKLSKNEILILSCLEKSKNNENDAYEICRVCKISLSTCVRLTGSLTKRGLIKRETQKVKNGIKGKTIFKLQEDLLK